MKPEEDNCISLIIIAICMILITCAQMTSCVHSLLTG